MQNTGFPTHVIIMMYQDQVAALNSDFGKIEWFGIKEGIRKGCILTPTLFKSRRFEVSR